MTRSDLLKKLFQSYQKRDDAAFRAIVEEIIQEERRKQHPVLANELSRIMQNGNNGSSAGQQHLITFDALPQDSDRRTPLLEIKQPSRYFGDLILGEDILRYIQRVISEFRDWEVLLANGLRPTRRVLFCGPSGCGKTATAEAIAAELELPMLYVRFDAVVSSLLGETSSNIRKVFDFARRGHWVLFFDEFDAIGRSRDDATEHSEIKRVVNSFLQIMDTFDSHSLVIAATNFEQALDPAVWRRFDEVIRFEKPDNYQLRLLAKKLLIPLHTRESQLESLIKSLTGRPTFADVERVCLDIRKACALRGNHTVRDSDIKEATQRYQYRQNVMQKVYSSSTPAIDQE